jgi:hypothetical protein
MVGHLGLCVLHNAWERAAYSRLRSPSLIHAGKKVLSQRVSHTELTIMCKLFCHLCLCLVIKFLQHAVVKWLLFPCWHLLCSVVNEPCVMMSSCCCNACYCGVLSCVLRCGRMCVCGVLVMCQRFLQMLMLLMLCVDQLITNNFLFFFFNIMMRSSNCCIL